MKRILYIICFSILGMILTCCQNDSFSEQEVSSNRLEIVADIQTSSSRIDISDEGENGLKLKWNENDVIVGYWKDNGTKRPVKFTIDKLYDQGRRAIFIKSSGKEPASLEGVKFYLCCVPREAEYQSGTAFKDLVFKEDDVWSDLNVDLKNQSGLQADINQYAYLCASGTPKDGSIALHFVSQYSVLKLSSITDIPDGINVTSIKFSADGLVNSGTISETGDALGFDAKSESLVDSDKELVMARSLSDKAVTPEEPLYIVIPLESSGATFTNSSLKLGYTESGQTKYLEESFGDHNGAVEQSRCYGKNTISYYKIPWLSSAFLGSDGKYYQFAAGNAYKTGDAILIRNNQYTHEANVNSYFKYSEISPFLQSRNAILLSLPVFLNMFSYTNDGFRIAQGTVNNMPGVIIIPVGFKDPQTNTCSSPEYKSPYTNQGNANRYENYRKPFFIPYNVGQNKTSNNVYTIEGWKAMDEAGAVFMPYSGDYNNVNKSASNHKVSGWYLYSDASDGIAILLSGNAPKQTDNQGDVSFAVRPVRVVEDYDPSKAVEGTLPGVFSVSATKKVFFSKGNLQYQAKGADNQSHWQFAKNQYDIVGEGNKNISSTYEGWIDLFGYGTSGSTNDGQAANQPCSNSSSSSDYLKVDLTGDADWGFNKIENGGNAQGIWRTLTNKEWEYLLRDRCDKACMLAELTFDNINRRCLMVFPDGWTWPSEAGTEPTGKYWGKASSSAGYGYSYTDRGTVTTSNSSYYMSLNSYKYAISSTEIYNVLVQNGVVFLPESGYRNNTTYNSDNSIYWSSSYNRKNTAGEYLSWGINLQPSGDGYYIYTEFGNNNFNYYGDAVRLVRDAN